MAFLASAPRTEVHVVATAAGKSGPYPKVRVWLMEDRSAIICVPGPNGNGIERIVRGGIVESGYNRRSKVLSISFEEGEPMVVDAKGCGCNLGQVGAAGPLDGRYKSVRVRADWHTEV